MTKVSAMPQLPVAVQAPPPPALAPQATAAQGPSKALHPLQAADPAKIAKSARDFEAMAIGQLLQPMFDSVDSAHSTFGGGPGEEAWKPMLVQEFAKQIEARGGLGLAKPIYDAMLRMQETNPK
jgi:flagellar protein FlgJ